ncbi:cation:proton antiporter family protein [Thermus thermamylovorans]|uniref:Sodium:proton exchanger n=1 Tax=Thermus thermamylovorans TaxID=2509362 RepID=A0A4Q9B791_9DEIN|nr:cation:proton antiporter family protein [Thermus thermamylovorans]TBH20972.1 sodium:proton exchanger [Thermus thermamylovorans]
MAGVLLFAYLSGVLAVRLGLPAFLGYLAVGAALGLGGFSGDRLLDLFADLGVYLLLFTVGLGLRLERLVRREVLGTGVFQLLLLPPFLLLLYLLGLAQNPLALLVLAVALVNPSTVLLARVLQGKGELSALHGQIALGVSVFLDVASLALLILVGFQGVGPLGFLVLLFPLLRPFLVHLFAWAQGAELKLLLGVALALLGAEAARLLGAPEALGALFMGLGLARHPGAGEVAERLWALREVFLLAFFVKAGMAVGPDGFFAGLLLLLFLLLKPLFLFLPLVRQGFRARTAFLVGVGLATYSEFALVAAGVLQALGYMTEQGVGAVALAVGGSFLLAAPLLQRAHRLYEAWKPRLHRLERPGLHPDEEPQGALGTRWLVVGMGRTGAAAYRFLAEQGEMVLGLDSDPSKVEYHAAKGRRVLYGDAEDPALWEGLDLTGVRGVILALPDLEARLRATRALRQKGFRGVVGAVSYAREEDTPLLEAGVDVIFHPLLEAGERLAERVWEKARAWA